MRIKNPQKSLSIFLNNIVPLIGIGLFQWSAIDVWVLYIVELAIEYMGQFIEIIRFYLAPVRVVSSKSIAVKKALFSLIVQVPVALIHIFVLGVISHYVGMALDLHLIITGINALRWYVLVLVIVKLITSVFKETSRSEESFLSDLVFKPGISIITTLSAIGLTWIFVFMPLSPDGAAFATVIFLFVIKTVVEGFELYTNDFSKSQKGR